MPVLKDKEWFAATCNLKFCVINNAIYFDTWL